jgi:hypothetical protein
MKRSLLNIIGDRTRNVLRQALSPTFLLILLGSALLWYTSKLSYEYTTDMPLGIRIDGQRYRLTATVKGRGSDIIAQRLSMKSRLVFTLDELASRRSTDTPGALIITKTSLQNAINGKIKDLKIVQVTDAPLFVPRAARAEADKSDDGADQKGESERDKRRRERRERKQAKEAARAAEKAAEAGADETPKKAKSK